MHLYVTVVLNGTNPLIGQYVTFIRNVNRVEECNVAIARNRRPKSTV